MSAKLIQSVKKIIKQNSELLMIATVFYLISCALSTEYTSEYVQRDRFQFTLLLTTQFFLICYLINLGLALGHTRAQYENIQDWIKLSIPALIASCLFAISFYYSTYTSDAVFYYQSSYWIVSLPIVSSVALAYFQSKSSSEKEKQQERHCPLINYIILNGIKLLISIFFTGVWFIVLLIPGILLTLTLKVFGLIFGLSFICLFFVLALRFFSLFDDKLQSDFNKIHQFLQAMSPFLSLCMLPVSVYLIGIMTEIIEGVPYNSLLPPVDILLILGFATYIYTPTTTLQITQKTVFHNKPRLAQANFFATHFGVILLIGGLAFHISQTDLLINNVRSILLRSYFLISLLLLFMMQLWIQRKYAFRASNQHNNFLEIANLKANKSRFARRFDLVILIIASGWLLWALPIEILIPNTQPSSLSNPLLEDNKPSLLPASYLEHDFKTPYEDAVSAVVPTKNRPNIPKEAHDLVNNYIKQSHNYICKLPKSINPNQPINLDNDWAPCVLLPITTENTAPDSLQLILFKPNFQDIPTTPQSLITVNLAQNTVIAQPLTSIAYDCRLPWLDFRLEEILRNTPSKINALSQVFHELVYMHAIPIDNLSIQGYHYKVQSESLMCSDYLKVDAAIKILGNE